jgi:hypothetical protein
MEAFLLGENYLVALVVAVAIGLAVFIGFVFEVIVLVVFASVFCVVEVSDISCFVVPSLAVVAAPVIGFTDGLAVAAAKLDVAPATSDPATRSVKSTFFMVCLSVG